MASRYDAIAKRLIDANPGAWLHYLGIAVDGPVAIIDPDLSTIRRVADKVFRVDSDPPLLVQLEVQASYDASLPRRMFQYAAGLLDRQSDDRIEVASVALLLVPRADGPAMAVPYVRGNRVLSPYLTFHYGIVRAWERPATDLLAGDISTLPLSPLCRLDGDDPRPVLAAIAGRLRDAPEAVAADIWNETAASWVSDSTKARYFKRWRALACWTGSRGNHPSCRCG